MIRPTRILLGTVAVWGVAGGVAAALPALITPWAIAGWLLLALFIADVLLVRGHHAGLHVERQLPGSLPVGVWHKVQLHFVHRGRSLVRTTVFDHLPGGCEYRGLPLTLDLPPGRTAELHYEIKPVERGDHQFGAIELRLTSPFRFWDRRVRLDADQQVRVYPNFAELTEYALLATDNRLSQLGVLRRRRRGEGLDFHQLREYREGDTPRQIDWNATARMGKLISREYQDERDQQVLFLIDCGRRMNAKEAATADAAALSHFDHCLNAVLLLAYVALRQGDAAGFLTFGTETPRFVAPRKSGATVNQFLNALYDLQPTLATPDYYQAALEISRRQKRRALVIIVTNLRDEDDQTLRTAVALLRKKHLVVLANLRETVLDQIAAQPIETFDHALTYGAAQDYAAHRATTLRLLEGSGVMTLDVPPEQLPISLVNRYLDLKRSAQF